MKTYDHAAINANHFMLKLLKTPKGTESLDRVFSIARKPQAVKAYVFFLKNSWGDFSTDDLMQVLDLPEASAHKAVKVLRNLNLIEPTRLVQVRNAGPQTQLYCLRKTP